MLEGCSVFRSVGRWETCSMNPLRTSVQSLPLSDCSHGNGQVSRQAREHGGNMWLSPHAQTHRQTCLQICLSKVCVSYTHSTALNKNTKLSHKIKAHLNNIVRTVYYWRVHVQMSCNLKCAHTAFLWLLTNVHKGEAAFPTLAWMERQWERGKEERRGHLPGDWNSEVSWSLNIM